MLTLALAVLLGQNPLDSVVDRNRVLLVFAPQAHDVRLEQQMELLKGHKGEMKDRDLLLVPVLAESGVSSGATTLETITPRFNSPADQNALRTRFRVAPNEFAVVLVGKDGGEKLRSAKPITAESLDRTIDAMPMRKDEVKARKP